MKYKSISMNLISCITHAKCFNLISNASFEHLPCSLSEALTLAL